MSCHTAIGLMSHINVYSTCHAHCLLSRHEVVQLLAWTLTGIVDTYVVAASRRLAADTWYALSAECTVHVLALSHKAVIRVSCDEANIALSNCHALQHNLLNSPICAKAASAVCVPDRLYCANLALQPPYCLCCLFGPVSSHLTSLIVSLDFS